MIDREVDGPVWAVLGRSWGLCGRSWAALGASVGRLGLLLGLCGRSWAALGPSLGGPGPLLGPLLAVRGRLGLKSGPGPSGKAIWTGDQAEKWPKPERERSLRGISLPKPAEASRSPPKRHTQLFL